MALIQYIERNKPLLVFDLDETLVRLLTWKDKFLEFFRDTPNPSTVITDIDMCDDDNDTDDESMNNSPPPVRRDLRDPKEISRPFKAVSEYRNSWASWKDNDTFEFIGATIEIRKDGLKSN